MEPNTTLLIQAAVVLGLMIVLGGLKYYTRKGKLDRYTRHMAKGRRRPRPMPPPGPTAPSEDEAPRDPTSD